MGELPTKTRGERTGGVSHPVNPSSFHRLQNSEATDCKNVVNFGRVRLVQWSKIRHSRVWTKVQSLMDGRRTPYSSIIYRGSPELSNRQDIQVGSTLECRSRLCVQDHRQPSNRRKALQGSLRSSSTICGGAVRCVTYDSGSHSSLFSRRASRQVGQPERLSCSTPIKVYITVAQTTHDAYLCSANGDVYRVFSHRTARSRKKRSYSWIQALSQRGRSTLHRSISPHLSI